MNACLSLTALSFCHQKSLCNFEDLSSTADLILHVDLLSRLQWYWRSKGTPSHAEKPTPAGKPALNPIVAQLQTIKPLTKCSLNPLSLPTQP